VAVWEISVEKYVQEKVGRRFTENDMVC